MSAPLLRTPGSWRRNLAGVLILAVPLALLPLVFSSPYALSNLILIGINTMIVIGLCLLMGYAGQISLGQAAFFGMGAYGSAVLTTRYGWSPWLAMPLTAAGTGLIAYSIGMPIFRLRGHYLVMGTLAFGVIVHIVLTQWREVTGGPSGLPGIPRLALGSLVLRTDLSYYYLVWGVCLLSLLIALNLVESRFGRALRAIRDSQVAAESLGIEVGRYKLQTLAISAVYASVAGSLYAHYVTFISPGAADMGSSIRLVLMAAVGGMASIWGAPFGTAAVILLTLALREVMPLFTRHGGGEHQIIAYGLLLVGIMIFLPRGLAPALTQWWRRIGLAERLQTGLRTIVRRR
ncbi:MAG TPA: branched-chain amino acid ABC transporter permease [Chloroflexi bacterium]|jgi:branched-chain amino acid transport system permease protein|nr:branched-chain amino acid ABC transporter permease [Chloroflexota bacterium]